MRRPAIAAALLLASACAPPMRWEKPGSAPARDEAACRGAAHGEAIRRMPYGNGPPIWGVYRDMSMLQWTQAIDIDRSYLEEQLVRACMRERGYALVPAQ